MSTFVLVFIAMISVGHGQEKQSAAAWLDQSQVFTLEIENVEDFQDAIKLTDFLANERWGEVRNSLTHEEFGWLSSEQWDEWVALENQFHDHFRLSNVVFSVDSLVPFHWQLIAKSSSENLDEQFQWLTEEIARIDAIRDESNDESRKEPATDRFRVIPVKKFDGMQINRIDQIHSLACKGWWVIANDLSGIESIAGRITGIDQGYRRLTDSRKYQSIHNAITGKSKSNNLAYAGLNIDPRFIWFLSGWFDEQEQRAWGLDEILASGLAINLLKSKTRTDRVEIVVDGFVKVAKPRVGISDAIQLKGRPQELPPTPADINLFYYVNMDWQLFSQRRQELFDEANGQNSYIEFLNGRSRMSKLLGDEYRQKNRSIKGTVQGACWFITEQGIQTLNFSNTTDVELQISALEYMTKKGGELTPNYGFERGEIGGKIAMLSKRSSHGKRFGILFMDHWLIQSMEFVLEELAEKKVDPRFPTTIDSMIQVLLQYSDIKDDRSIVLAIFPEAWQLIRDTAMSSARTRKIFNELKNRYPQDFDRVMEELGKTNDNWDSYELPEPRSREECLEHARLTIGRIVTESFGKLILLGNDNGDGLRLSAMIVPDDGKAPENTK